MKPVLVPEVLGSRAEPEALKARSEPGVDILAKDILPDVGAAGQRGISSERLHHRGEEVLKEKPDEGHEGETAGHNVDGCRPPGAEMTDHHDERGGQHETAQ